MSGSSNSSGNNTNSSNTPTDSSANSSENISEKLAKFGEDAENLAKIFVPVSAIVSALFLFGYHIYDKGYREYFSIGDEWAGVVSLSSILNFIFIMLAVIVLMTPNFLTYALSNLCVCWYNKWKKPVDTKIVKILKIIVTLVLTHLILIAASVVLIFYLSSKVDDFNKFSFPIKCCMVFVFWFIIFGVGFFFALNNRPLKDITQQQQTQTQQTQSQSQQLQSQPSQPNNKPVLHIGLPICIGVFLFSIGFVIWNVYSEGLNDAKNKKEFKKIQIVDENPLVDEKTGKKTDEIICETTNWIILAENDDKILLAELTSEADGKAEINTKKQRVIENGEYDYDIIKYEAVEKMPTEIQ